MWWLVIGALAEIFWVSGLKYFSDSIFGICAIILGVIISFNTLIIACKKMEVSIAYSIFVGLGTLGIVFVEIFYFKQNLSLIKMILIFLLMLGIIGLKLVDKKEKR